MPELNINFSWRSNAQSNSTTIKEVKNSTEGFARMIVDDFAIAATEQAYLTNRAALVSSVRAVALAEVSRMAMLISNGIAQPDKYSGPRGQISINGARGENGESRSIANGMSETAKKLGFRNTFDRGGTDIGKWPKRQKRYLDWKREHGHPQKWWELNGELAKSLKDKDQYLQAWGPVNVLFTRARNQSKAKANMAQSTLGQDGGALASTSRSSLKSVTHAGRAGRISAEYQVGKLEVIALGKITARMLPGLGEKNMNPYKAKPGGNIDGLAGMLADDGPGGTRNKLLGKQALRRYALEPFASFFLTRAIPNAIWRRTELLIAGTGIRTAGKRF
jgi:hypothetical protein